MILKRTVFITLFVFSLFLSQAEARPKNAAYFVYGNSQTILTEPVDGAGKAYILQAEGTWLHGARLEIPVGALSKEAILTVSYNDGVFKNVKMGKPLEGAVLIELQGISKLSKYISLTLSSALSGQENGCMGFVPDEEGTLSAMTSIHKNEIISFRPKTAIALICS